MSKTYNKIHFPKETSPSANAKQPEKTPFSASGFLPLQSLNNFFSDKNNKTLITVLIIAVLLLAVIPGVTFKLYIDSQNKIKLLEMQSNPQTTPSQKELDQLVKNVAKHIILPEDQPQIVTVRNVDTLKKEQPFFQNAQNGHKLLIYSGKVIIYDPVKDLIVDIAYIKPSEKPQPTIEVTLTPQELSTPSPSLGDSPGDGP